MQLFSTSGAEFYPLSPRERGKEGGGGGEGTKNISTEYLEKGQRLRSILISTTPNLAATSHSLDLGLCLPFPQLATLHTLI